MDDWNQKQHGASGLIARVRASNITRRSRRKRARIDVPAAAGRSRAPHPCAATASARTGASWRGRCRELERYFHYRNLDVSTLKELARRWAPEVVESFAKRARTWRWPTSTSRSASCGTTARMLFAPAVRGAALASGCLRVRRGTARSRPPCPGLSDMLSMPCSSSQRARSG